MGWQEADAPLAVLAREVWQGYRGPGDFMDGFASAVVWTLRTEQPGLLVTDTGSRGRWMPVFSTPERLVAYAGDGFFISCTGAELLSLVPPGVGLMLDPADEHRFPILARMAPPDGVASAWAELAGTRRPQNG
ncbi:SseB family protein [Amycolatopsis benzoatilytica]|uniref:SseB family protein n=1 Tax=Amycolatopsis benzoatilytica TaxID=346045 RepID=UPI0003A10B3A|nr:SseB family protein [Amycolatopsis benzoatilytica]